METITRLPGLSEGKTVSTLGIRGRVWMRRMLSALRTTTTIFTSGRCEQFFCGGLDEADDLVARHSREPGQKLVDGLPLFQVIDKVLHGHPRSGEDGGATHDLRIRVKNLRKVAITHAQNLPSGHHRGKHRFPPPPGFVTRHPCSRSPTGT